MNTQVEKHEITQGDGIIFNGKKLRRIKALKNVGERVLSGEFGGYVNVNSEKNLAQVGDTRVYLRFHADKEALVYGKAHVYSEFDMPSTFIGARVKGAAE